MGSVNSATFFYSTIINSGLFHNIFHSSIFFCIFLICIYLLLCIFFFCSFHHSIIIFSNFFHNGRIIYSRLYIWSIHQHQCGANHIHSNNYRLNNSKVPRLHWVRDLSAWVEPVWSEVLPAASPHHPSWSNQG